MTGARRYLPEELTYKPEPQPESVVAERHETWLQSPVPTYSPNGVGTIRFQLNTSNFVDLASINMTSKIFVKKLKASDATAQATFAASNNLQIDVNDTYSIFSSISLATGNGTVIEQLDDVVALAQIVKSLSFSNEYLESSGSFFNGSKSNKTGYSYNTDTGTDAVPNSEDLAWEVPVLKLLGFLNCGKIIRPSTFGGLVFNLTLAPNAQCWTVPVSTTGHPNCSFEMNLYETRLYYDEIIPTDSYRAWYNQNYETKGFRIMIDTYSHTSSTENGTVSKMVRIPISVKRCKALISVLRPTEATTNEASLEPAQRFLCSGKNGFRYQYTSNGTRYPPAPITSYARAHTECMKICAATHDGQRGHSCNLRDFSNNFSTGTTNNTDPVRTQGAFMMGLSLEKLGAEADTGTLLDPSTTSLEFSMDGPSNDKTWVLNNGLEHSNFLVSTFALHASAITVMDGRVVVEY